MNLSTSSLRSRIRTSDKHIFGNSGTVNFNIIDKPNDYGDPLNLDTKGTYQVWSSIMQEGNVVTELKFGRVESKYWRHWFRLDTPMVRPTEIMKQVNHNMRSNNGVVDCARVPNITTAQSKNFIATINQLIQMSKSVSYNEYNGNIIIHATEIEDFISQLFHSIYHADGIHRFYAKMRFPDYPDGQIPEKEWGKRKNFRMVFKLIDDGDGQRIAKEIESQGITTRWLENQSGVSANLIDDFIDYACTIDDVDDQNAILNVLGLPAKNGFAGLRDADMELAYLEGFTMTGGARIERIMINPDVPTNRFLVLPSEYEFPENALKFRKGMRRTGFILPYELRRNDIVLILYTVAMLMNVLADKKHTIWDYQQMYDDIESGKLSLEDVPKIEEPEPIGDEESEKTRDDTLEELKQYKKYYDMGLITKEEYSIKKKQVLGI